MLSVVALLPTGFGVLIWFTYRAGRIRATRGEAFRPEGKVRWSGEEMPDVGAPPTGRD